MTILYFGAHPTRKAWKGLEELDEQFALLPPRQTEKSAEVVEDKLVNMAPSGKRVCNRMIRIHLDTKDRHDFEYKAD